MPSGAFCTRCTGRSMLTGGSMVRTSLGLMTGCKTAWTVWVSGWGFFYLSTRTHYRSRSMIRFRCKHCNEDLTADEVASWHRGLDEAQKLSPLVHPDLTICRNN